MVPFKHVPQSRWPALVAGVSTGVLLYLMPDALSLGPRWLPLLLITLLFIPTAFFHHRGRHDLNTLFSYIGLGVTTVALISSLALLVWRLPRHLDPPGELLRAAVALWLSNMLTFASWYWRLDGGGPNERDLHHMHKAGAFLFPQMQMTEEMRIATNQPPWSPGFVDYLFLSFNTSTAFSPTDVPVLARWAKLMMMLQSLISLGAVVLLAARAVNIL